MSDYLTDLLSRSFGAAESIRPRLPSAFEPAPYVDAETAPLGEAGGVAPADTSTQHETAPAEPSSPAEPPSLAPRGAETVTFEDDAGSVGMPTGPRPPENAATPPNPAPEETDTSIPEPALGERAGSVGAAPVEPPIDPVDSFLEARDQASEGESRRPAPGTPRLGDTPSPKRRDGSLPARERTRSARAAPRIGRTVTPKRLVRDPSEARPRPEATSAHGPAGRAGWRPDAMIRSAIESEAGARLGSLVQPADLESAVSEALAAAPPVEWSEAPLPAGRPTIEVQIGRIEVRSTPPNPPAPPREPLRARKPALSLDDYLKRRRGGSP